MSLFHHAKAEAVQAIWTAQAPGNQDMTMSANWGGTAPAGNDLVFDAHQATPQTVPQLANPATLSSTSITFAATVQYTLDIQGQLTITNFFSNPSTLTQIINLNNTAALLHINGAANSDVNTINPINYNLNTTGSVLNITGPSSGNFGSFSLNPGTGLGLDTTGGDISLGALAATVSTSIAMNNGNVSIGGLNTNTTVSGVINDGGPSTGLLTKIGTGTLTLSAINTYGKPTVITGGTLQAGVANTITSSGALTIGAAGIFDLNNTNNEINNLSGSTGGLITLGSGDLLINQTTGSLIYGGTISGSGTVTLQGGSDITFAGVNSYTGGTTVTAGTLIAGAINTIESSSSLTLNGTSIFDISAFNNEVSNLSGAPGTTILLGSKTLTVNEISSLTFSGILNDSTNGGKLVKIGSGTLTLAGANTYTGGTTISAGVLEGTTTSLVGNFLDNASLVFDQAANGAYTGIISGTGTLTIDGGATINFNQAQQYTGATTITNGTLQASVADVIKTSSSVFIDDNGHFDLNGFDNQITTLSGAIAPAAPSSILIGSNQLTINQLANGAFDGVITGTLTGKVVKIGSAILTLTGANSYGGGTTITDGALVGTTTSLQGPIEDDATLIFDQNFDGSYTGVITTALTGGGTLEKAGTGALTFTHQQQYQGPTFILDGTIKDGSVSGNIISNNASLNIQTTGTFDLNNNNNLVNNLSGVAGASIILGSGTLTDVESSVNIFAGDITSGTGGGFTKDGPGLLTLEGANTYNGPTSILNGTLVAGATNTLSSVSSMTISATGTLALTFPNTIGPLTGATGSKITLGTAVLTVSETSPTVFHGVISSTGAGNGLIKTGLSTLTLSGVSTYTGPTTINGGTLQAGVANIIQASSALNINGGTFDLNNFNNTIGTLNGLSGAITLGSGALTINQTAAGAFGGVISGSGTGNQVTKNGTGTLTLSGISTYTGPTLINTGTLQAGAVNIIQNSSSVQIGAQGTFDLNNHSNQINTLSGSAGAKITLGTLGSTNLTVVQNSNQTFAGVISGGGALFKNGPSTLILTGANTYGGGTAVFQGNLQGNTTSLRGNIVVFSGGTLTFDQPTSAAFVGQLSSSGNVVKQGIGTLTYNTDQSTFTGLTSVNQGLLVVSSTLGGSVNVGNLSSLDVEGTVSGNVTVGSGGLVIGKGTIGGTLTANSGSNIRTDSPFQTLTINGDFHSQANSIYNVEANFQGNNSRLNIGGMAFLAGNVQVNTVTSTINTTIPYTILHATGGIQGEFANLIVTTGTLIKPTLTYGTNDVFLRFTSNLVAAAATTNELNVAEQLDSIANPNPDEALILNILVNESHEEVRNGLNAMSGEQYTYLLTTNIYSSERLTQRLYNAVRAINFPCWCQDQRATLEPWFQFEGGNNYALGDINSQSMTASALSLNLGVNVPVNHQIIVGAAGSYEQDRVKFEQGGRTIWNIWQGSVYTLLRSKKLYLFADATIGGGWGEMRRHIQFSTIDRMTKSRPRIEHGYGYCEVGYNTNCNHILIQPYIAAAYGVYHQHKTTETGAESLNLVNFNNTTSYPSSYLGSHFTTTIGTQLDLNCDLAWHHRYGNNHISTSNEFTTFGQKFGIKGSRIGNDAVEVSLNATFTLRDRLTLFVECAGERWVGWSAYGIDVGISYWW